MEPLFPPTPNRKNVSWVFQQDNFKDSNSVIEVVVLRCLHWGPLIRATPAWHHCRQLCKMGTLKYLGVFRAETNLLWKRSLAWEGWGRNIPAAHFMHPAEVKLWGQTLGLQAPPLLNGEVVSGAVNSGHLKHQWIICCWSLHSQLPAMDWG